MQVRVVMALFVLVLGMADSARAHHSQARFDLDTIRNLTGTVARFDFTNPHVYLYLDTTDEAGNVVTWELEASSTPNLIRRGWNAESVTAGEQITVRANPSMTAGISKARLQSVIWADGNMLAVRDDGRVIGPADETAAANSLAGTWLGRHALTQVSMNLASWPLTPKGSAAQAAYDGSQNPQIDCIPVAAPLRHAVFEYLQRGSFRGPSEFPSRMDGRRAPRLPGWTTASE